jgi:hypothetical protein
MANEKVANETQFLLKTGSDGSQSNITQDTNSTHFQTNYTNLVSRHKLKTSIGMRQKKNIGMRQHLSAQA